MLNPPEQTNKASKSKVQTAKAMIGTKYTTIGESTLWTNFSFSLGHERKQFLSHRRKQTLQMSPVATLNNFQNINDKQAEG